MLDGVIICGIAAATLGVSVYSHATIVRLNSVLSVALTVVSVVVSGCDLIRKRLTPMALPQSPDDLVGLLASGEGEAALTCLPDMSLPEGQRWASLATVILEPTTSTARILDGTPADSGSRPWRHLAAERGSDTGSGTR